MAPYVRHKVITIGASLLEIFAMTFLTYINTSRKSAYYALAKEKTILSSKF